METNMDKYLGTLLDDRYEIIEIIGEGGMATVYKAMCHRLNRYVAVKILRDDMAKDEEFRRRFQIEAQAVAMLSHPNIVSVYDVSHSDDVEYIVMELIEGITLKQYMKKKGILGWKEALHFSMQIARALEHAHSKGVIHRDIKPQNIMILKDGTIKVADFGISALENMQEQRTEKTIGSVHYIAPEQAKGGVPDARSDVYSLGVVMYEMLTARLPYDGDTTEEIARKHIAGGPVSPLEYNPDAPGELVRITLKAMNSDINARYQSATELIADLEAFRKAQTAAAAAAEVSAGAAAAAEPEYDISPDVTPVGTTGELSKEKYKLRRVRSKRVSFMSGVFGVLAFLIVVFVFLWNYWLADIFSVAERVEIPDFTGEYYENIINNSTFQKNFNFTVQYSIDPSVDDGVIISQDPEAGRSLMVVPDGISVTLTVSTGIVMTQVPDVTNWQYQEATLELQNAGFIVEQVLESSDSVTEDYVIGTSPAAGESLSSGSTVYMTVSSGPTVGEVTVPNLVGLTEAKAKERIESSNLVYVDTTYIYSDYDVGTVIKQSEEAYSIVDARSKIYLWVSLGPEPTPTPEDNG